MKLIISGATGFVANEIIRQSLSRTEITSIVALARKPVSIPEKLLPNASPSKLKSVVIKDYDHYPEEVKNEFAGAAACIWTVAITPSKSKMYDFEEVKRICQTSTIVGFKAIHESGVSKPFRFLYMSGAAAERDPEKAVRFQPQYSYMRGETENQVLALAAELDGVEASVAKPGYITAPGEIIKSITGTMIKLIVGIPSISVVDLATAMLDQVINGFEKDPLMPEDLIRIAKAHQQVSE
ncbi:putative nucleoside-diphosphate-sugar epimerase protein [Daldinia childiae]|uniref:putative nucleoside-diphosphate-sugar epimerase protein n=1 Tax=Daldinia childiae TaxID=326645 RepID=UPI0014476246|nr:putative nucleoside-diphosphate-sugar epimerase protein [Daldinia childiae]KAF3071122.1 putative nucleoside-diphosphate-sugar epimerase protein [Daldinia childiae]